MTQVKALIADLARPFSIYITAGSAAWATVRLAYAGDASENALYIGAVYAGLGALYWGRAWENQKATTATAEVEKAKAQATPPPGTAQITAAPDVDVTVREANDKDDDLPPSQRVNR